MIRVMLADDEAVIRAGVRMILSADPDIEVVAEAADGRALIELVRAYTPSVPTSLSSRSHAGASEASFTANR